MRLQEIAENYNVSYDINLRFEHLLRKQDSLEAIANQTHDAMNEELSRLKAWMKKIPNKAKKLDLKMAALEASVHERDRESYAEARQLKTFLSNLTQDIASHKDDTQELRVKQGSLQKALEGLQDALKTQGTKLDELEQLLKSPLHNEVLLPSNLAAAHLLSRSPQEKEPEAAGGQSPTLKKLRAKHGQWKKLQQENLRLTAQSQSRGMPNGSLPVQRVALQESELEPPPLPDPQALRQQHPLMDKASEDQKLPGMPPRKPGTST